jgi:predicted transcriptional regulator
MHALGEVSGRPVNDFLNRDFASLQTNDNAAKAVALMHKKNALTIPVYDGQKLVGVVGRHDIINIAFA